MIDESEYMIPGFLPEGKPLRISAVNVYDGGTWGLYVNYEQGVSWLVSRASYNGIIGWRVTLVPYIATISWSKDYVKNFRCGVCE